MKLIELKKQKINNFNMSKNRIRNLNVCIVGLGYVGLPLSIEISKKRKVICYDKNINRIKNLKKGLDTNNEITNKLLLKSKNIYFTSKVKDISESNFYIVTVPTPITKNKIPDLKPLISASKTIAKHVKKNDIIVYESTVFPGLTEELLSNVIEKVSKLKFNIDFFLGYSPERINPGDKKNTIENIVKVTSGSDHNTSKVVNDFYKSIIKAGTFKAKSIKIAEAAKVIENTQRDLNIALINEFSIIFNKMNLSTYDILKTASTKWNFLDFKPGLVGGHCIGVDPYYLTYKSKQIGYTPKVILSGRKLNDNMGKYVVKKLIEKIKLNKNSLKNFNILILGITFKENCSDVRNSKIIDINKELIRKKINVENYDPLIKPNIPKKIFNYKLISKPKKNFYDGIIVAVAHNKIKKLGIKKIRSFARKDGIIFDLKNIFESKFTDIQL